MSNINTRITPSGDIEDDFRLDVRLALDADIFTRDDQIIDEIRRLKRVEAQYLLDSDQIAAWKLECAEEKKKAAK